MKDQDMIVLLIGGFNVGALVNLIIFPDTISFQLGMWIIIMVITTSVYMSMRDD